MNIVKKIYTPSIELLNSCKFKSLKFLMCYMERDYLDDASPCSLIICLNHVKSNPLFFISYSRFACKRYLDSVTKEK